MPGTIDLSDVTAFVRVVEHGGFTPAARALGVPKSTLSRRVARLEESLGVRLLQRTSRRQSLTDAGGSYFERVRDSVRAIESASLAAAEHSEEPRGHLRIAALPDLGGPPFPEIVAEFLRRYPKVTVELHVSPTRVDLVREGFDLAIRAGKLDDSSLVARKVMEDELRLYASPAYLDARGRPKRFADLARHDQLALAQLRNVVLVGPRGKVRYRPSGRLVANDMKLLHSAACAGAGVALLAGMLCVEDVRAGRLEPVLPQYVLPAAPISLVYPSGRHLDAKVRAFRDFAVEQMQRATAKLNAGGTRAGQARFTHR